MVIMMPVTMNWWFTLDNDEMVGDTGTVNNASFEVVELNLLSQKN